MPLIGIVLLCALAGVAFEAYRRSSAGKPMRLADFVTGAAEGALGGWGGAVGSIGAGIVAALLAHVFLAPIDPDPGRGPPAVATQVATSTAIGAAAGASPTAPAATVETKNVELPQPTAHPHLMGEVSDTRRKAATEFDENFYRARYPDVDAAIKSGSFKSGYQHFETNGAKEGRCPNPFFDEKNYLAAYPDVATAVAKGDPYKTGFDHYRDHGYAEGRDPAPNADQPDAGPAPGKPIARAEPEPEQHSFGLSAAVNAAVGD